MFPIRHGIQKTVCQFVHILIRLGQELRQAAKHTQRMNTDEPLSFSQIRVYFLDNNDMWTLLKQQLNHMHVKKRLSEWTFP